MTTSSNTTKHLKDPPVEMGHTLTSHICDVNMIWVSYLKPERKVGGVRQ